MPATETDALRSPVRRLTLLYVLALSTVALLSLGAQWLIQRQLSNGESDSRVINVAGRQRMLSQRLAKAALQLEAGKDAPSEAVLQELRETLDLWAASHRGLRIRDDDRGLPGGNSVAVAGLFKQIEPHFKAMQRAARELLSEPGNSDPRRQAVRAIASNEGPFLVGMDAIVSQYVAEAEARVVRLRRLESIILATTLGVLLLEGLLVFRPAARRIGQAVERLREASVGLCHARDEAERANDAKTRFLANVSHELRTPMTAVLGMTELAQQTDDPAKRCEYLSVVEEAGESLMSLLNDLIDIARIDADRLDLREQPFDPTELVLRTERLMRSTADAKGIDLVVDPASGAAPRLWGDEKRLGQVLINLVGNAIKWTDVGAVTVGCSADTSSDSLVALSLWVQDTGVGIAPEEQERVFEPFAQVTDSSGPKRGGAGLGLSICRRIVEAMNGSIDLSSTPGVGTTVRVECELPLATAAVTLDPVETLRADGRDAQVLVIEDSEVTQKMLRRTLEESGHRVTVCADAASGLAAFAEGGYDIVLTDLQLPDRDGATVAREVRTIATASDWPTPVIACVTAHSGAMAPVADEAVFDEVLLKPIRRERLLDALSQLLGTSPSDQAPHADAAQLSLQQELAEAFSVAAPSQLAKLAEHLHRGELSSAGLIAHRFAGQVAYFDAHPLRDRLLRLEEACESGEAKHARKLGEPVILELTRLIDRLA